LLGGCVVVIVAISVIIGGCVVAVAVVVGVVGEVLAGLWGAIGRLVFRFNVLTSKGANMLWMLAFKASKSKRGGGGARLLRFGVGVGNAAAVLVVVDVGG